MSIYALRITGDEAVGLNHQSGAVLVVTLLVMLAVTILGVAGLQTTTVELRIARNEREIRESFYLAEAAAMEGVQRLINAAGVDLEEQFAHWHHFRQAMAGNGAGFRDAGHWDCTDSAIGNCLPSPLDRHAFIAAVEWRVAPGGSLLMTESRLVENRVYGLCTKHGAHHVVEIGYLLRY